MPLTLGVNCSDFLMIQFKRYLAKTDKKFDMYIKQKKNDYEEGQDILEHATKVMAANNYKSLVSVGGWNTPSMEQ